MKRGKSKKGIEQIYGKSLMEGRTRKVIFKTLQVTTRTLKKKRGSKKEEQGKDQEKGQGIKNDRKGRKGKGKKEKEEKQEKE